MTFNIGWECPKCGRCYAPTVTQCAWCVPMVPGWTYIVRGYACSTCGGWITPGVFHACWTNASGGTQ